MGKAQDATLGEETYNYYNVGVHTCDKGATRQFIEAFCNKKLNITYYTKEDVEAGSCTQNDVGKIKAIAVGKELQMLSFQAFIPFRHTERILTLLPKRIGLLKILIIQHIQTVTVTLRNTQLLIVVTVLPEFTVMI